jgi:signal transduction histidine kinase
MDHDFALLILDVRMPDTNGLELAKIIKQRKKTQHIPIIFLTAYFHEDEYALQGYDAGAVDYIAKPFNSGVLRSKVAVFAELYRVNRALHDEIGARIDTERRLAVRTSEVQQLVGQLRALALELMRTEQRERRRLAKILHDHLQQLLVSTKMQLFVLQRGDLSERSAIALDAVQAAIEDAIAVSRSVTVELSPPILDQAGLAPALEWLAGRLNEQYKVNVNIHAADCPELNSEEERLLLFECTRELLFNAIKHAGVPDINVELTSTDEQQIEIVVADRGVGFDWTSHQKTCGTQSSFGLFSVQQRLAHLGGSLDVQTSPGQGTRMTILAPGQRGPADRPPAFQLVPSADPTGAKTPSETISLLIVDDHTIVRQSLAGLLRAQPGLRLLGEAGGREDALRLADELHPDVILMDVNLGADSGLEVTRTILARHPDIKVIGLSMHDEAEIAAAMREVGAVGYVSKAAAAEQLIAVIRSVN